MSEAAPKKGRSRRGSIVRKKKPGFQRSDQLSVLEMYEKDDSNNPLNQKFKPYEGFNGPSKQRHMTDKMCLPILLVLMVAIILHAILLISMGDPTRLSNNSDFRGEVCGVGGLVNLRYLYYGQPTVDANVVWCVEKCPSFTGTDICLYDIDHFTTTPFCYVQLATDQVGRMCLPREPINRASIDALISTIPNQVKRFASDLWLTWDLVFLSMVLVSATAFVVTFALGIEQIVLYLVWTAVWGSLLCFASLAWMFWREYERVIQQRCLFQIDKHGCGGQRASLFQYLCLITSLLGAVYLVYVMKLFNKINLGIGLIKAASKITSVLKQLRFFAIFIAGIGILFTGCCYVMVVYGLTIGSYSKILAQNIDGNVVFKYQPNFVAQYTLAYPAFMLIFIMMFVLALNEMFNSYALSVWYFTKKKAVVQIPLLLVFKELVFHHIGTCVYLTFMQMLFFIPKWGMYYAHYVLRSLPQYSLVVRYIQGCCLCCLCINQHCLRYINKHSMVQVAVWSDHYSDASEKSFFVLNRNQNQIRDLDFLVEFILFQLKLFNSLFMSLPIYFYLSFASVTPMGTNISDIESPLIPTLLVFLCGFFFTSVFQGTYDICAKSVIQLYLIDTEMFYAEQRFTEPFISKFMEFYGTQEEKRTVLQSSKQIKYTAKVAPAEAINKQNEEEVFDEEEEDDDDPINDDEDEDEEDDEEDDGQISQNPSNPQLITNIKPKQMKVINADPFELAGADNVSEVSEQSVFGDFLNGDLHNGRQSNQNFKPKLPAVPKVLQSYDFSMGNADSLQVMLKNKQDNSNVNK